jgi:diguanylate cyclase (GGDEF)-like protein/hemerythrin-like metal-binding protein/PAS domain S-box-containing protein
MYFASDAGADAFPALIASSDLAALALADYDRFLFANGAFSRLFGRTDGLAGVPITDLFLPGHRAQVDAALRAGRGPAPFCIAEAFRGNAGTFDAEMRFERVSHGGEALLAISAQDITERSRTAAQLKLLAYSDPLTGLANRALFSDRLRHAAMASIQTGHAFAVIALDLDGFKPVNDRHGHDAGDFVLQRVASRLLACLRGTDTVARLGGDEFAVLLPDFHSRAGAADVAERLAKAVRQPISLGKTAVQVGVSAGIAAYPENGATVDHLLAAADGALYEAKGRGRGCAVWATAAVSVPAAPAAPAWDAAHEIGVNEIDRQHSRLASMLDGMAIALRNGQEHAVLFRKIVAFTRFHFATEERMMLACRYSGAAIHRDMHRRLLDDLERLRLDQSDGVSASLTIRYLQEWLLRHIDGADRDLAVALQAAAARGVRLSSC